MGVGRHRQHKDREKEQSRYRALPLCHSVGRRIQVLWLADHIAPCLDLVRGKHQQISPIKEVQVSLCLLQASRRTKKCRRKSGSLWTNADHGINVMPGKLLYECRMHLSLSNLPPLPKAITRSFTFPSLLHSHISACGVWPCINEVGNQRGVAPDQDADMAIAHPAAEFLEPSSLIAHLGGISSP